MGKLRKAVTVLVLAGLVGLAGVWVIGSKLTAATNSAVEMPADPARFVEIASTPGIRLAATWWPGALAKAPAVLMLHGNGSNRAAMAETAVLLNRHGYAVLALDLRGHGQSSTASKSFGLFESEDARAGFDWLRTACRDCKIGVIGFSLDGAASLLGKQGPLPADAFVLEGVYPDIRRAIRNRLALRLGDVAATMTEPLLSYQSLPRFGVWPSAISPVVALAKVEKPVFVVGGGKDANTPPEETRALFDAARGQRDILILEGVSHDQLGRDLPESFQLRLLGFFDRTLTVRR